MQEFLTTTFTRQDLKDLILEAIIEREIQKAEGNAVKCYSITEP